MEFRHERIGESAKTEFEDRPDDASTCTGPRPPEALRQQKLAVHDQVSRRMLQAMVAAYQGLYDRLLERSGAYPRTT